MDVSAVWDMTPETGDIAMVSFTEFNSSTRNSKLLMVHSENYISVKMTQSKR